MTAGIHTAHHRHYRVFSVTIRRARRGWSVVARSESGPSGALMALVDAGWTFSRLTRR